VLRIELPGVVSWTRPRRMKGAVRYPAAYARARDAWALLVAQAVRDRNWRPPPTARYRVEVEVDGGGKRDLDRVCTAVLDALQAGHAVRDDCLVDALTATRQVARDAPATTVEVATLPPARRRRGTSGGRP
jgi:Holliday junction resolvase RusA-like endonuclease